MSKMASHEPFEDMQHNLWSKEGPRVKLAIWLSTTKSRELTRSRCVQMECDTLLQSSWGELQDFFRLIPIWGLSRELQAPKVPGVQTGTISGLLLGSPENKSHLDAGAAEQRREYYMGEGGGPGYGESSESMLPVACPNTKNVFKGELTNLWLVLL
jgi:hypothetical protein